MRSIEGGMNTRIRKAGARADRATGNMSWAEFVHFTSRPVGGVPDPHLHAHCFVFNATFDEEEQRWKAGEFAGIKSDLEFHEAAFHLNLANRLQAVGYAVERRGKHWDIAGISPELTARFSRRTAQVEALAKAHGMTDAKQKDQLGAKTREKKARSISLDALREEWSGRLSEGELAAMQTLRRGKGGPFGGGAERSSKTSRRIRRRTLFARRSVVPESKLRATAIRRAIGSGANLALVETELQNAGLLQRKVGERMMVTARRCWPKNSECWLSPEAGRGAKRLLSRALTCCNTSSSGQNKWPRRGMS